MIVPRKAPKLSSYGEIKMHLLQAIA